MTKYKLREDLTTVFNGVTLYRVELLEDCVHGKKGSLGGFIEKESNLTENAWVGGDARVSGEALVSGNAWVGGDARVSGEAWVRGNAWVGGSAWVGGNAWVDGSAWVRGNAWVGGSARVSGEAWVRGNAWVGGSAWVGGNAWVDGNAQVFDEAQIFDNAEVITTPAAIQGVKHPITITETHIFIGCQGHKINFWESNIIEILKTDNYSKKEISQVIKIIQCFVPNFKVTLNKN